MPAALLTAADLPHVRIPNKWTELVRGQLVVCEPPGALHGYVAVRLAARLVQHVEAKDLGAVFAAETGFKLFSDPDTVRAPDVAFVSNARLPHPLPSGYPAIAPDLAVEVLSPGDRPGEMLAKVADWLEAGSTLVWVTDPVRRVARAYRADGSDATITETGVLAGENVLPGFECALASILG